MITRASLAERIEQHLEGSLTLEDLAAWAEDTFRDAEFETAAADLISDVLATIRDAVDPHRFRWEEPDFELMLDQLRAGEV